jgi:hypothetical protein
MLTDLRLCDCELALGGVPKENAGLKRKADCGKTYFRSLLDPTPVISAAPPLSLATAEDGPQ